MSPFCFQGFWSFLSSLFWILCQIVCLFPFHLFGLLCFYLVTSFVVFLCLVIGLFFFLIYCFWGLLYPGFKESWILSLKKFEFFLPFGFCPPKVGPMVCVSLDYCEICAEFLFVFPLMGKAEKGSNPVCWWFSLYFCFVWCLDRASYTGCYWRLGDARFVLKSFCLCEFSLFDTP